MPKRERTLSTCETTVDGSDVFPANTSTATGQHRPSRWLDETSYRMSLPPFRCRLIGLRLIQGWRSSSQLGMAGISLPVTGPS